jgi:hypothetical protein
MRTARAWNWKRLTFMSMQTRILAQESVFFINALNPYTLHSLLQQGVISPKCAEQTNFNKNHLKTSLISGLF